MGVGTTLDACSGEGTTGVATGTAGGIEAGFTSGVGTATVGTGTLGISIGLGTATLGGG